MKYLLPLLLCLSASAVDWNAYYFGSANTMTNANNGLAQLPVYVQGKSYLLRGVTTTNDSTLIGDLRYATITLTAHTVTTGIPSYAWLGCTTYNPPPNPLNVRLFLASDAGTYNVAWGMQHHTNYWWSQAYCLWSNQTLTITATVDPSQWSDADGHMGNYSPEVEAGFWTAMANVADQLSHPPQPNPPIGSGSSAGDLAGDGEPTTTYPSGPSSGTEGTSYVDRLTGRVWWWYSSQWN